MEIWYHLVILCQQLLNGKSITLIGEATRQNPALIYALVSYKTQKLERLNSHHHHPWHNSQPLFSVALQEKQQDH